MGSDTIPLPDVASAKAPNGDSANDNYNAEKAATASEPEPEPKPPSKFKQIWAKTGLDVQTCILIFKGSLPPTIAVACYQANSYAETYSTLGYLTAIISILGLCILPRGLFLQNLVISVFTICLFAALNLLALYTAVQARIHTTNPHEPPQLYNSSASAVCAIWLIFFIYWISAARALRPQLISPTVIGSILCVVNLSTGPLLPNMEAVYTFEKRLLEAFLTGLGFSTGVALFIFPVSSRFVVMKQMAGYVNLMNSMLKLQGAFMASLENIDPDAVRREREAGKKGKEGNGHNDLTSTPPSIKLRETLTSAFALHNKISGDLVAAKREFAIGKLESHDLSQIWKHLRTVFVPVMGLTTLVNMLETRAETGGWNQDAEFLTPEQLQDRRKALDNVKLVTKKLHEPFAAMTSTLGDAFQHVLITLELVKPPKKKNDEEAPIDGTAPGSSGFAAAFQKKVETFYASKEQTLRQWFHDRGIELPADFFTSSSIEKIPGHPEGDELERRQQVLFFLLYLEHMLWRVSQNVLDLIMFLEKRKQEGAFARSKLIFPGSKTLYKWATSLLSKDGMAQDNGFAPDLNSAGVENVYLGEEFLKRKDPEHFPPRNAFERMGDYLRGAADFFRSDASAFGFRVVLATMTVGIINYLHSSQAWFIEQRLVWAEIMIAISMLRTAGQSVFNFGLRVAGTTIATVATYVVWYIVDGKTVGVIVFLWIWTMCCFYVLLKFPKFLLASILSLVTTVLIIAYELQVRKIGIQAAESNNQPAYPIYELAPYRLATVSGGLFVAFIWTIFPYSVSESSEIRKDLAATMYLLSNYYSVTHETVLSRLGGKAGSESVKGTHSHNLEKARSKVFSRLVALLTALRTNSVNRRFQINIGGRFPQEDYDELIAACQRMVQWISLINFASQIFDAPETSEMTAWRRDFRTLLTQTKLTSHEITSLLTLLSSSLTHGQPLPPYVQPPEPFRLAHSLNQTDADILNIRHIIEPEYSAFAVLQALTYYISLDVRKLKKHVTVLVGEIDFSYHAVKSSSLTRSTSSDSGEGKDKDD